MTRPSPAERKTRTEACKCPSRSCPHPEGMALESSSSNQRGSKTSRRAPLARLVSQDDFLEDYSDSHRTNSPPRCVSDFDQASIQKIHPSGPCTFPNPLMDPLFHRTHVAALRLEAELYPMRLILGRLMGHQTHNRRGIFNTPVDAVALGLFDYHQIIETPMDLGTIKKRLHAVAYSSRQEVSDDIRLVFTNAMRYNPPRNPIHLAAKELLIYFEQALINTGDDCQQSLCTEIPVPCAQGPLTSLNDGSAQPLPSMSDSTSGEASFGDRPPSHLDPVSPLPISPLLPSKKSSKLAPFLPHSCGSCQGRTCTVCHQGCLYHEPALMVCSGLHCGGARLRKGTMYFVTSDGNRHYCERCHTSLQAVLPGYSENDPCRYKQDLLKRMNHEEIPEQWLECSSCSAGVHVICAMHNTLPHDPRNYICPDCQKTPIYDNVKTHSEAIDDDRYTFVSGSDLPVAMTSFGIPQGMSADSLPKCAISSFIQAKIETHLRAAVPNSEKTVTVRIVSDSSRHFTVPDVVQRHFCMATSGSSDIVSPPSLVRYRQKAIALFQRMDGLDVCIFCMYVQEYDGEDDFEPHVDRESIRSSHAKRVYIAYIDSVEHFRPRDVRTDIYHEILVSYLASARSRGYEKAHIWACPPSRGNSFVFWNHPASQRTPNQERLLQWYHGALSKAVGLGIVTDVKSLYESEFESSLTELDGSKRGRMICPPLLDGDFWIEEAVRVHSAAKARYIKIRAPTEVCVWNVTPLLSSELDPCPALQIAALVKDRLMTHPSSVPFRRPVNAAALNLQNYHEIVPNPMDLGTIYAQCVIGEYQTLEDVVHDIELMVSNAKRFNPVGHYVHTKADEVLSLFYQELMALMHIWDASTCAKEPSVSWRMYAGMTMSLDERMVIASRGQSSVFIEDDRSMDGTRSINSSSIVSIPSSPMATSKEEDDEDEKKIPALQKGKRRRRALSTCGRRRSVDRGDSPHDKVYDSPKKLDILMDGPEAVVQSMVGKDFWLLEKRQAVPVCNKRRRSSSSASGGDAAVPDEQSSKLRRQVWVGEEVSEAVRRMRTIFFTCFLTPKPSMSETERSMLSRFETYASDFDRDMPIHLGFSSPISDARHALLEFSQYRGLEFDTLRRAKYSTAMLLFHLQNIDVPGVVPVCSTCSHTIEEVRWHKVKKATERRRATKFMKPVPPEPLFIQEELCGGCHAICSEKEEFIPIPVCLKL